MRLYVVPTRDLANVSSFMVPFSGKYSARGKKPKRATAFQDRTRLVIGPALGSAVSRALGHAPMLGREIFLGPLGNINFPDVKHSDGKVS
jgi:hypothetical protein